MQKSQVFPTPKSCPISLTPAITVIAPSKYGNLAFMKRKSRLHDMRTLLAQSELFIS